MEEEARLRETIEFIDSARVRLRDQTPDEVFPDIEWAMAMSSSEPLRELEESRPSPYFGRVDFRDEGNKAKLERHYFG